MGVRGNVVDHCPYHDSNSRWINTLANIAADRMHQTR